MILNIEERMWTVQKLQMCQHPLRMNVGSRKNQKEIESLCTTGNSGEVHYSVPEDMEVEGKSIEQ
jgi:hypothetical protein